MLKLVPEPRLLNNFSQEETFCFQIYNLNNNNVNLFQVNGDCQITLKGICRKKQKSVVFFSLYRRFSDFSLWGGGLAINFEPQRVGGDAHSCINIDVLYTLQNGCLFLPYNCDPATSGARINVESILISACNLQSRLIIFQKLFFT